MAQATFFYTQLFGSSPKSDQIQWRAFGIIKARFILNLQVSSPKKPLPALRQVLQFDWNDVFAMKLKKSSSTCTPNPLFQYPLRQLSRLAIETASKAETKFQPS